MASVFEEAFDAVFNSVLGAVFGYIIAILVSLFLIYALYRFWKTGRSSYGITKAVANKYKRVIDDYFDDARIKRSLSNNKYQ